MRRRRRIERIAPMRRRRPARRIECVVAVDESMELRLWAEVEEEADFEIGGAEIIVELARGCPVQFVRGLRLDDEAAVHDHVEALAGELLTLVRHTDGDFACDRVAAREELALEGHDVDVLEEAEAERVVDVEECADDGAGERRVEQWDTTHEAMLPPT